MVTPPLFIDGFVVENNDMAFFSFSGRESRCEVGFSSGVGARWCSSFPPPRPSLGKYGRRRESPLVNRESERKKRFTRIPPPLPLPMSFEGKETEGKDADNKSTASSGAVRGQGWTPAFFPFCHHAFHLAFSLFAASSPAAKKDRRSFFVHVVKWTRQPLGATVSSKIATLMASS